MVAARPPRRHRAHPAEAHELDIHDVRGTAVKVQRTPLQKVRYLLAPLVSRRRRGR
ncbi:hypothetical protein ACFQX8_08230 [Klenkia terrae]|uniref:hypothetical protein n=1 Tax=Klenkia terrae TaxID=1052259 RepID=UPI00360E1511